jgi:3-carboxy-cis,cis-muconate cycloisomerase
MLVARNACALVLAELDGAAAACASLAESHRSTPMAGRTLMQQAVPITFGLKAAGWLVALVDARRRLAGVRFTAQLGGPAGTIDPGITSRFAAELELDEPVMAWHADRRRWPSSRARSRASPACAKAALDVVLLAQTEVGRWPSRVEAARLRCRTSRTRPRLSSPAHVRGSSTPTQAC